MRDTEQELKDHLAEVEAERDKLAAALTTIDNIVCGLIEGATLEDTVKSLCGLIVRTNGEQSFSHWWDEAARRTQEAWMDRALKAEGDVEELLDDIETLQHVIDQLQPDPPADEDLEDALDDLLGIDGESPQDPDAEPWEEEEDAYLDDQVYLINNGCRERYLETRCSCPPGRCWYDEQIQRRKVGLPALSYSYYQELAAKLDL